jgi:signal transduction histidine kinase
MEIDLVALARETTALVAEDPAARGVRFEIEGARSPATADRELLKIVLLNVLLNATHAVQSSGTVRTSVAPTGGVWQIAVADSGPGIAADIRDRIFMPFFTTKSKGTGLGLPTAKRLVEAHHGRIRVDCPPAGGTIVTIELPREAAEL